MIETARYFPISRKLPSHQAQRWSVVGGSVASVLRAVLAINALNH